MTEPDTDVAGRWECWECAAVEGPRGAGEDATVQIAVCHHCGKPLCQEHWTFVADNAFSRESPVDVPMAFHCSTCWTNHGDPRAVRSGAA
jgi:hypothetical protein